MKAMMKKLLPAVLFFSLLLGCAPFSRQALQQVDVTAPFQEVQKDPQKYINRTVLWGGVIIETTVRKDATFIKVVDKDLDWAKQPELGDMTYGRFIIRYAGFLDPAIYKPEREVSVIGKITGAEVLPVGELQYTYPVVEAQQLHLWELRAEHRRPVWWDYPVMPYPYWRYPYGSPYYW